MFYRIVGVATGLASMAFLASVFLAGVGSAGSREDTSLMAISAGIMAIGLLTMIWHLNWRQTSDSVKGEWRGYLTYLGPLAASVYLVQVAPLAATAALTRSPRLSPLMVFGLAVLGFLITLLAHRNVGPVGALAPAEAVLNYLIRLGGVLAVAAIGAGLGLRYWRAILWMLIPSFMALYAGASGETEIVVGILGAALLLTWLVATGVSRVRGR